VAPADGKSVAAIEKLIGQAIPWGSSPAPDVADDAAPVVERPRHRRARKHERRTSVPQTKRQPSAAHPAKHLAAAPAKTKAPRAEPSRPRDSEGFPLPAFLLRPVKA